MRLPSHIGFETARSVGIRALLFSFEFFLPRFFPGKGTGQGQFEGHKSQAGGVGPMLIPMLVEVFAFVSPAHQPLKGGCCRVRPPRLGPLCADRYLPIEPPSGATLHDRRWTVNLMVCWKFPSHPSDRGLQIRNVSMEPGKINRRIFLGQAPVVGAGVASAAPVAATEKQPIDSGDVFRVGCLNVSSYSHLAGLWAPLINPRPGTDEMPLTGMRITHCWEIDHDRAKGFAETFGCQAVKNFDDMLGKVDGIISGGYYNHPWNHILHEPYLEAGLPNLINRPFANSLAKARKMVETARKHNATLMVPSAFEHNNATASAKAWASQQKVICYHATNSFDDYPTHGIHGVYLVCRAIAESYPIVSVSFRSDRWYRPPGVMTFEHQDQDGRPFYGTLHQISSGLGSIRIHAQEQTPHACHPP